MPDIFSNAIQIQLKMVGSVSGGIRGVFAEMNRNRPRFRKSIGVQSILNRAHGRPVLQETACLDIGYLFRLPVLRFGPREDVSQPVHSHFVVIGT